MPGPERRRRQRKQQLRKPKSAAKKKAPAEEPVRTPAAEQLLIDAVRTETVAETAQRVLCTSLGRGQLAASIASEHPEAEVACFFLDVYHADAAREFVAGSERQPTIVCAADPPSEPVDLAAFPFRKGAEAELMRDLLQHGHETLVDGGRMLVSFDSTDDAWLHDELRTLFPKVTRQPRSGGVTYAATKRGPLKKRKDFGCEFAFRDREQLVKAFSRPGVFSHRRVDGGTRALLAAIEVEPTDRVLDLGCGAGTLTAAVALRATEGQVLGIDSNARAVACTATTATLNELANVDVHLTADGSGVERGAFDLVVGNPPYFSKFEIARVFVDAARRAVRPGGCVAFVTRKPDWFVDAMSECFDDVATAAVKSYFVVAATGR